jgi:hypothetical protein
MPKTALVEAVDRLFFVQDQLCSSLQVVAEENAIG